MASPSGDAGQRSAAHKKRTAVLVVHGIGSQRALETVRSVVEAVRPPGAKVWTHPEKSGIDIDLPVMTMEIGKGTSKSRSVDFHEFYWAHLMSETRAVAVLLWLFELVRKGPRLNREMRALWYGASIFLCMLLASVVLLSLHATLQFLNSAPLIADNQIIWGAIDQARILLANRSYHEPDALVFAPLFVICMVSFYAFIASLIKRAVWIALPSLILTIVTGALFFKTGQNSLGHLTVLFFPAVLSCFIALIIMGRWGLLMMGLTFVFASVFFGIYLNSRYMLWWEHGCAEIQWLNSCIPIKLTDIFHPASYADVFSKGWTFWSLNERYSSVIAVAFIVIYLAAYAAFLQPFLGDAARYFRASPGNVAVRREIRKQAVDTLSGLHESGRYDRIIVVAHSLGTVIAYDMLRAYFSRVCNELPMPKDEPPELRLDELSRSKTATDAERDEFRKLSRLFLRDMQQTTAAPGAKTWLVTDFVTLGSALVHAKYLMCTGSTEAELNEDFKRRVDEREFPTCPPIPDAGGDVLFFHPDQNEGRREKEFHHGAIFGLTRWTNLYFPLRQLFWGDAIGGPLAPLFGRYIVDVKAANTNLPWAFFTHSAYWDSTREIDGSTAHIERLIDAIDLNDRAVAQG